MDTAQKIFNPFEKYDNGILLRRVLSTFLDYFIIVLLMFGLHFITRNMNQDLPSFIALFLFLAYFIFLEGYFGATPGKLFTGIRIVDLSANPPGLWKATIRTLTRILELNPILFGCLPGGVISLSNQTKQRMGDIIAHTHVWRLEDVNRMRELIYQSHIEDNPNAESENNESLS